MSQLPKDMLLQGNIEKMRPEMERAYLKSRAEVFAAIKLRLGLADEEAERVLGLMFDETYWRGALDAVSLLSADEPKTTH